MDLKPQGSQLKTVRQKANLVKQWVLEGVDRQWLRDFKRDHPTEYFKGMIQSLPHDVEVDITSNIINVIRHMEDSKQELTNVNKSKVIDSKVVLEIVNDSKDKESGVGGV